MATHLKNLSEYEPHKVPSAEGMKIGIIVAEWNSQITKSLYESALKTLIKHGIKEEDIITRFVPGSFELTFAGKVFAENSDVDAVILLGCVIQGETRHFDFICQSVTQGVTELNLKYQIPFIFGILTTLTVVQAIERAGGKHGNKGDEAAITAIKMVDFQRSFEKS